MVASGLGSITTCYYDLQPDWFMMFLHNKVIYTVNKVVYRKHYFTASCGYMLVESTT